MLLYSLGGSVPLGSRKSYPLLATFCDPFPDQKCSIILDFSLVSDPVERDHILDQFSMITRPYTRPNGLKTIPSTRPNGLKNVPSPAAHTRIANIWEYPPPPRGFCAVLCRCPYMILFVVVLLLVASTAEMVRSRF